MKTAMVSFCSLAWMVLAGPVRAQPACVGWIGADSGAESGATILLDGKRVPHKTPATLKEVPCGEHSVEVTKPLFVGGKAQVVVQAGEVAKVQVALKANFGGLDVESRPGGAELVLDGNLVGKTPIKLERIEAGVREVTIRLPDHASVDRKVTIAPGKLAEIKVTLVPDFGALEITAAGISGALVWLDGDPLGEAPIELKRVVTGKHLIRVTAELYKPFEAKLVVPRGKTTQVKAVLKPDFGTVAIRSRPAGARLRIDGREAGQAPITLNLSPGLHDVWAVGDGAAAGSVKSKVRVKLGGKHKLVLKLPVKSGSLMIDSVPFAASIEIDGKKRGKAPLSIKSIPIGTHVLLAKSKGFPPLAGRIEVVESKRSVAEMNLKDPTRSVYTAPEGAPAPSPAPAPQPQPVVQVEAATKAEPAPDSNFEPMPEAKPAPLAKAEPAVQAKPEPAPKPEAKPKPKPKPEPKPELQVEKIAKANPPPSGSDPVHDANTDVSARAAAGMSAQRLAAWIAGGTAVAAAVTGGVMFGLGFAKESEADDAYNVWLKNQTPTNEKIYKDLDNRSALYKNVGWGMFGAAVGLGAVSVILFLTEPEPEVDVSGPADGLSAAPLPGGGWVGYRMRF